MIVLALWRFVLRTPWSTAVTLVGVMLGVASIVSVHLISATVAQRLDALNQSQLANFSHFLHRPNVRMDDYVELRRRWRAGELDDIQQLAPMIDEHVVLQGTPVRVLGIDLFRVGAPTTSSPGEDRATIAWDGVWVGGWQWPGEQPVNGRLESEQPVVVADIGVAQALLGWPSDQLSFVAVQVAEPLAQVQAVAERWLPGVSAGLPQTETALGELDQAGWQVRSIAEQQPGNRFGKAVLFNISALGTLALLVAWFLIYQVAVTWLRRLQPVFIRLHALGVDLSRLGLSFVGLLSGLGGVAALGGILLGWGLAQLLYSTAVPNSDLTLTPDCWLVSKAMLSALGVCVLGGGLAFQRLFAPRVSHGGLMFVALAVLAAGATVGVLSESSGLLGAFFSIAVLSVFTGLLIAPLLHQSRHHSHWIRGGYLARLSWRELFWFPSDLSVALSGLTLAVATAIGVGIMVDSFRQDFSRMLDRRLSYDVVVDGTDQALSDFAAAMNHATGVKRLQGYRSGELRLQGVPSELVITRMDQTEAQRYAHSNALQPDEILVGEQLMRLLKLQPGQSLDVAGQTVRIAGQFQGFGDVQPRILADQSSPLASLATTLIDLSLRLDDPQRRVGELAPRFSQLQFTLQQSLRQRALETFDETFTITSVLITIAILVAAIGVYIAATAMRLNRQAGTQLLTALGVTEQELLLTDVWRGLSVGVAALVFALPLGLAFGWILCAVVNPRAFGWEVQMQLTTAALLPPLLWGLLAALVAGVLRVGKQEPLAHGVT